MEHGKQEHFCFVEYFYRFEYAKVGPDLSLKVDPSQNCVLCIRNKEFASEAAARKERMLRK